MHRHHVSDAGFIGIFYIYRLDRYELPCHLRLMAEYIGNELELFSHAGNWKGYYANFLKTYIRGSVLEAGAGIGETTRYLLNPQVTSWHCLEPDPALVGKINEKKAMGELPADLQVTCGTLKDLATENKFDTIVYIDVLEHIEDDKLEMELAERYLRSGGHLIVLVPAHNFLFSEFDRAIGHFRRYNKKMLRAVSPPSLVQEKLIYLDSAGMMASMANRMFLRQRYPGIKQVQFWDRVLVPLSKKIDAVLRYTLGKTAVGIWRKQNTPTPV